MNTSSKPLFIIVTGMSGSGRSFALKTLEDMGYDTVDNLPFFLWERLLLKKADLSASLAIGLNITTPAFNSKHLLDNIKTAKLVHSSSPLLVFIDCQNDILGQRYSETRRPHPLARKGRSLEDAIQLERRLLITLRRQADVLIDTSSLKLREFRKILSNHFNVQNNHNLNIIVNSFAYRHGLPRDADIVIDARILRNPYYSNELKNLNGLQDVVQTYIKEDPIFYEFSHTIQKVIRLTLNHCKNEHRSYLTIAFGCTGGYHRSVFMAEYIGSWLKKIGQDVEIKHNDIYKN